MIFDRGVLRRRKPYILWLALVIMTAGIATVAILVSDDQSADWTVPI